ncbi:phosphotransferase enzyme family protein [Paenibacillus solisilvae]|uniref:Phosphotransferase enzyme family protein n=1 Tax=Paenibacillus solisilvae TaxID=2486751 RepID=A0ABW0VWE0_9BACL
MKLEKEVEAVFGEPVLEEGARRFGLVIGSCKKLGDFENYVFEMERGGEPCILRLTHSSHRSEAEVAAELDWINFLASEGLTIPKSFLSVHNKMTERIETGDSYFTVCLFQKAEGHLPDFQNPIDWNMDLILRWGAITGQMHEATRRYTVPDHTAARADWDDDELLQAAEQFVIPGDEFVLERLGEILEHLRALPRDPDSYGLIHTDIHPRNFFVNDDRITVFDFDDCSYNWFVHDLAIPLYYSISWGVPQSYTGDRQAYASDFVKAFWSGYRDAYSLPNEWLKEIPQFLKLRDITLYLVIHKKEDPAHMEPRLQKWLADIKDRIKRDAAIVDLDYTLLT